MRRFEQARSTDVGNGFDGCTTVAPMPYNAVRAYGAV